MAFWSSGLWVVITLVSGGRPGAESWFGFSGREEEDIFDFETHPMVMENGVFLFFLKKALGS